MEVIRHIQIPLEEGDHVVDVPMGAIQFGNMYWVDDIIYIPLVMDPDMRPSQYTITCIKAESDKDVPVWNNIRAINSPYTLFGACMVKGVPMYVVEREGRLRRRFR